MSFGSEAGSGGYFENSTATTEGAGFSSTLSAAFAAGSRSITVAATTSLAAGDYIRIEAAADPKREVRRVTRISTLTLYLDAPTGFPHDSGVACTELDESTAFTGNNFMTFLPGVYESITTPDLTPEFLPQYFLSTTANRNWSRIYRGRQSFTGSIPNMILLNGFPLRFPIGRVSTTGTASGTGASTMSAASLVGDIEIGVTDGTGYANGEFVQIGTGTTAEVRQIISGASGAGAQTFVLNYPMMIAHANATALAEVTSPYTHTLTETAELDSVSWHLNMEDSAETAANDFIRRFFGGVVSRATISADEGGLVRMSWDDVLFLDLLHNQRASTGVTGDIAKHSRAMIAPTGIGGSMPHSGGALSTPTYPTTAPYYFSQGALTFFGVALARIRNFRLDINNNAEARYYIRDQALERTPSEIQEMRREYRLSATVAMEDSLSATATTRSLWKELILEGNYDSGLAGFDITLVFTRGTNDTITLTLPSTTATDGLETQGAFIVRAPHNIGSESPVQVDLEILVRNMTAVIVDSIGTYP